MKRINAKDICLYLFSGLLLLYSAQSCLELSHTYSQVAPGMWRGLLDLRDQATLPPHPEHTDPGTEFDFSETPTGVLPFNFEVIYSSPDSMQIYLINGEERMAISSYSYEPMVQGETGKLSLFFHIYDTHIEAKVEAGVMEGNWYVDYKDNYSVPFKAYLGQKYRFTDTPEKPTADISGRWAMAFSEDTPDEFPAIGEFQQDGHILRGNIATETGDYRYASGNVSGNDMFLSSFNGLQAYLYEGKIINQDSILGAFYSGNHYRTTWEGHRDNEATLRSPESITKGITDQPVHWQAESINGKTIDFDRPPYEGKIKIIEIMGSWCPNCHDEARFLKEWQNNNPDLPVEIVSLAFERYEDRVKSLKVIAEFQKRMDIDWPVVYGGTIQSANESELTNFIDQIRAYPTLIVFDSSNKIRYVHTGFYGPATMEFEGFKMEFYSLMRKLDEEL